MASAPGVSGPARSCQDCGAAVAGRSQRCGDCKRRLNRERVAAWKKANPEAFTARMQRNYQRDPAKAITRMRDWQKSNPERVAAHKAKETPEQRRDYYLRYKYGITLADQQAMLARQGGGCCICGRRLTPDTLAVDHDHDTGEVRGLLCKLCNSGLGAFEADPMQLLVAFAYLTAGKRPWIPCETEETA